MSGSRSARRFSLLSWWLPGVAEIAATPVAPRADDLFPFLGWVLQIAAGAGAVALSEWLVPHALLGPVFFAVALLLTKPLAARWRRDPVRAHTFASFVLVGASLLCVVDAWILWPHAFIHGMRCFHNAAWLLPILWAILSVPVVAAQEILARRASSCFSGVGRALRWLSGALSALMLGVAALVLHGAASQMRPAANLDYFASLEELGRLPSVDDDPAPDSTPSHGVWRRNNGGWWVAVVGDLQVFGGSRIGMSRAGEREPSDFRYGRSGALVIRRDAARGLVVIERQGARDQMSHDRTGHLIAFHESTLAFTDVTVEELFGPQPLPLPWVLLAASGLVAASLALLRERRLLRAMSLPGGLLAGVADEHGSISLPGGFSSFPPGARVAAGPVVVVPAREARGATYREGDDVEAMAVLAGTEERVRAAAVEARWNAVSMALAIVALTAAPLAVAFFAS